MSENDPDLIRKSVPPEELSRVWANVFTAMWEEEDGDFPSGDVRLESIALDDTTVECVQDEVIRRYNRYEEIVQALKLQEERAEELEEHLKVIRATAEDALDEEYAYRAADRHRQIIQEVNDALSGGGDEDAD